MLTLLATIGCRRDDEEFRAYASPYEPPEAAASDVGAPVEARAPAYTIAEDLSNVGNLATFTDAVPLDDSMRAAIARNGFACRPTTDEQLFYTYERNRRESAPSFVTVDTALQLHHVLCSYTLRRVEMEHFLGLVEGLTAKLLAASVEQAATARTEEMMEAARRNIAFFSVASALLDPGCSAPAEVADEVGKELALIEAHSERTLGAIFPYAINYQLFKPRGHYTISEDLRRYFLAMSWYGQAAFAPYYRDAGGERKESKGAARQGLLICQALRDPAIEADWRKLYAITAFFAGESDKLTPVEWQAITDVTFGFEPDIDDFADEDDYAKFVELVMRERAPGIRQELFGRPEAELEGQMRLMGTRYTPDSRILQELASPERLMPSGLDVMGALGSERARKIVDADPEAFGLDGLRGYGAKRRELMDEFAELGDEAWERNLYWNWVDAFRALLPPVAEGYPMFMLNEAWQTKSLNTALASWAELRHDTILYAEQSEAELDEDEAASAEATRGYIEPQPEAYARLLRATRQARQGLEEQEVLPERSARNYEAVEDLLEFLLNVSAKELAAEALDENECARIRGIGEELGDLTAQIMGASHWHDVRDDQRHMALVADVLRGASSALEVAVGSPMEILVVAPVDGKPTLTRGACFSYYEFAHEASDRLTDEQWQAMLAAGKGPPRPFWTESFVTGAEIGTGNENGAGR